MKELRQRREKFEAKELQREVFLSGMSMRQVLMASGLSASSYYNWKVGTYNPSPKNIAKLLKISKKIKELNKVFERIEVA